VAKLIREGYIGYLIRVINDEMTGGGTRGEGFLHNEQDNDAVAKALGLKKSYSLLPQPSHGRDVAAGPTRQSDSAIPHAAGRHRDLLRPLDSTRRTRTTT
jgi:hypothetical protein